jgi:hypothetical protein
MKFLAAEIAASFSPLGVSTIKKCVGAPTAAALRREMNHLELGGIWKQLRITNFLEGDLFSWYLAAWDERIAEVVKGIVTRLDEYDPSTLSVHGEKWLYRQGQPGELWQEDVLPDLPFLGVRASHPLLAVNDSVVFIVVANPKPNHGVRRVIETQRAIMKAHAHRPEITDFLEV